MTRTRIVLSLVAIALTPAAVAANPSGAAALASDFKQAIQRVDPAVVSVVSELRKDAPVRVPLGAPRRGIGSGVIVSPDGLIITNHHVVEYAETIVVGLADGRERAGEVVGVDPRTDIAVLKIDATDLPTATFGDSDALEVGDWTLAIGSPFGLGHTVTSGILSARGRADMQITDYEDFLQTDAAMNPGNSGGPLVNLAGEVIGINTAISARAGAWTGIGFAVPSNIAWDVYEQLSSTGRVARGYLGVVIRDLTPDDAQSRSLDDTNGALVEDVDPESPAAKAGVQTGDVVLALDDRPIRSMRELRSLTATMRPGQAVAIDLAREEERLRVVATLGDLEPEAADAAWPDAGLTVSPITPDLAMAHGHRQDALGVLVITVDADSESARRGVAVGDIITRVNGEGIANLRDFSAVIRSLKAGGVARVRIVAPGGSEKNLRFTLASVNNGS
jgi:serine protease Do